MYGVIQAGHCCSVVCVGGEAVCWLTKTTAAAQDKSEEEEEVVEDTSTVAEPYHTP